MDCHPYGSLLSVLFCDSTDRGSAAARSGRGASLLGTECCGVLGVLSVPLLDAEMSGCIARVPGLSEGIREKRSASLLGNQWDLEAVVYLYLW